MHRIHFKAEKRTSLQGTNGSSTICPLFIGFTVLVDRISTVIDTSVFLFPYIMAC